MKLLWMYGPRLLLASLVLWAGWGAMTIFLGGWRSLVEDPAPTVDVAAEEEAPGLTTESLAGGSWRFAGIPWSVQIEARESTEPPDPLEFVLSAEPASSQAGVPLQPRHREALHALTFLGATNQRLSDGRWLWSLQRDRLSVMLLLQETADRTVLLSGFLARRDAERNVWSTQALAPLAGGASPLDVLIPESARPTRIATRCDAEGRALLEIALVPPGDFTARRSSTSPPAEAATESEGLQPLEPRTEAGRTITYLRGPDRAGEPILVVATAATATKTRRPASQSPTGN